MKGESEITSFKLLLYRGYKNKQNKDAKNSSQFWVGVIEFILYLLNDQNKKLIESLVCNISQILMISIAFEYSKGTKKWMAINL